MLGCWKKNAFHPQHRDYMLEGYLSQHLQQTPKYCHHVVDVQHLMLDIFMQMRRRAIAKVTTQIEPYITCSTRDI